VRGATVSTETTHPIMIEGVFLSVHVRSAPGAVAQPLPPAHCLRPHGCAAASRHILRSARDDGPKRRMAFHS
jgi:hypothetical protein